LHIAPAITVAFTLVIVHTPQTYFTKYIPSNSLLRPFQF
jgi:hypothetical protein